MRVGRLGGQIEPLVTDADAGQRVVLQGLLEVAVGVEADDLDAGMLPVNPIDEFTGGGADPHLLEIGDEKQTHDSGGTVADSSLLEASARFVHPGWLAGRGQPERAHQAATTSRPAVGPLASAAGMAGGRGHRTGFA